MFGNNILQIAAALSFAKYLGAKALIVPKFDPENLLRDLFDLLDLPPCADLLDLPERIELREAPDEDLQPACKGLEGTKGVFWKETCHRVPARVAHDMLIK